MTFALPRCGQQRVGKCSTVKIDGVDDAHSDDKLIASTEFHYFVASVRDCIVIGVSASKLTKAANIWHRLDSCIVLHGTGSTRCLPSFHWPKELSKFGLVVTGYVKHNGMIRSC